MYREAGYPRYVPGGGLPTGDVEVGLPTGDVEGRVTHVQYSGGLPTCSTVAGYPRWCMPGYPRWCMPVTHGEMRAGRQQDEEQEGQQG